MKWIYSSLPICEYSEKISIYIYFTDKIRIWFPKYKQEWGEEREVGYMNLNIIYLSAQTCEAILDHKQSA